MYFDHSNLRNMFSSSQQNPRDCWLVLKPLLEVIPWHFINSAIPIYSILLDGEKHCESIWCFAQLHNLMTHLGTEPGPFDLESSALTN